jgi:DNA invertase Pin-like site-specific DNA recombinase
MPTAVAYVRVSTAAQGRSGLGLEAQRAAIKDFADREGIYGRGVVHGGGERLKK